jgi:uncharacterized cupredoxin-like copper-binding protein
MMKIKFAPLLVSLFFATLALPAWAHQAGHKSHQDMPKEQKEWGIGGDAKAVTRTIEITMLDTMRFVPENITVKQGETVRLKVKNVGKVMHELVIGTKQELDTHAEMMKKHPNMEHDEPYMAHVSPGKSADIIWNFNRAGQFDFACLLPGHYEAGMVGKINVIAGAK